MARRADRTRARRIAPTHASRTNRRHHTPSATVAGYPSVASPLLEPPERLAAVRAQGVDAGRAAGAAEMDATAAAQRVGCGHRNVADDGGWRRERAWGARPAAPTSRPPCACARPVRCAPFGQRDVGGTSEMWQRARRGDEGRGRGRASEVRAGAPDGRRVDRSCWATRSARRRSCRTRGSSRSGCPDLQARNEAAQDSAVNKRCEDGVHSRVAHDGGGTRASRAGAQAIMHYPAGKRGSLFGEGGSRRSLGSCQSWRCERTSQASRWTREVLGRCCTRWLWRMVLFKSTGVRTSRSRRFETEGAPREEGATSTLLAQIELRERAVGEKTRRPKGHG